MKKQLTLISIFILLMVPSSADKHISELRYSTEIEQNDKFTWDVLVYTDDGNDVQEDANHFGRIISGSEIEFTAIADPSKDNLADKEMDAIFEVFKVEIDGTQVTRLNNLGVAQFLIMPTQIIFTDDESKNYINYYFSELLNGSVRTDPDQDLFSITIEEISLVFENETIQIDSWELSYGRKTGILREMGLIGQTPQEQGGDNLELHMSFRKGFFARISIPSFILVIPFVLIVIVRKKFRT